MKRQWYYRGSLKYCNYSCSYCPFSKRSCSRAGIQKDKEAFFRFTDRMLVQKCEGAVLVVPYGEALLYPHYWEGLATLSQSARIDAAGAQSNFSFPAKQMLAVYRACGGDLQKLRLWGTFHPEMTSARQFADQCLYLASQGISYCAGAVGDPRQMDEIRMLRDLLPDNAYLWINRMDGCKQKYTDAQVKAFSEIDPFFSQELAHHRANPAACGENRFVEANGSMRRCNISRQSIGNFYEEPYADAKEEDLRVCTKKECACYLAYCNRKDVILPFFGQYPAFRIPAYPKAAFFDIDGTLVPKGEKQITEETARRLLHLSKRCEIFLATSLPLSYAKRKLASVWHVIRGGVFANGGRRLILECSGAGGTLDVITPMNTDWLAAAKELGKRHGFTAHTYQKGGEVYKVTLAFRPGRAGTGRTEAKRRNLAHLLKIPDSCRILWEEGRMQITKQGTGKLEGILEICRELGYRKEEAAVFGDSENDTEMLDYFNGTGRVQNRTEPKEPDCKT